ncbi:hypothetical protein HUJ05_004406, partial [Dendroctonus ponderosae]
IVRNKAAEKAKHAHQVATSAGSSSSPGGPVSVIAHAPSTQLTEARSGGYSINGILGLQHDPNGNSIKRKRIDDHDENRDLNGHHDDDIKRQRFQYNGDPLCVTGVTSAADIYDTINTMSQAGQNLYTPPLAGSLGSSSLTPLAPITMHEMKIETTRLMDPTKYDPSMSPYHSVATENNSPYNMNTVEGSSPSIPLAMPAEPPTSQAAGSPDPAALTVLQPSGSGQHYSTMLPSFTGYSGTTVVPGTDYAYSTAYSQYGAAYGTYGYGSASSGLLNSYYYTNNDIAITNPDEQTSRSPTAATRANSLAPANSPTESGSACLKTEAIYPHELNMG